MITEQNPSADFVPFQADPPSLVLPGRHCWRLCRTGRAAILIDGAAYFSAFRESAKQARHSILIIGWDLDSRTRLIAGPAEDGYSPVLGPFLRELTARRASLRVNILNWDFAMLYATDRELLPALSLGWPALGRVQFRVDGQHPVGGCQHQKIVVIDDAVAFVGGMDLAQARWDTPDHAPGVVARQRANGQACPPVHDVQIMVDGEAAQALGELARERWFKASGENLPAIPCPDSDPWPAEIKADFSGIDAGIARTAPAFNGTAGIVEIRELYLAAIRSAERWIYIENQYLTASVIGDALAARLRERDGPEIVVVSRLSGGGWLEENTMTVLRARLLRRLRAADRYRRFRIYYPDRRDLAGECINVHSKLMIVDDRLLQVGSSNLANRSLGVDSECDLVIEARDPEAARAIAGIRNRLLGEHLDVPPAALDGQLAAHGSLIKSVESLRGREKTLRELSGEIPAEADRLIPEMNVFDPEKPLDPESLIEYVLPAEHRPSARKRLLWAFAILAVLGSLVAAWHWGPLAEWLDRDRVAVAARWIKDTPVTPLWILAIYVLGSLAAMPVTLLIFTTALVFDPGVAFLYAMGGSLLGASASYGLGYALGRKAVWRFGRKKRLAPLGRWLRRRGLLAVITARVLPVAPFSIVNLIAGAARIRFRDFLLGTALGMCPGMAAVTFFSDRLVAAMASPSPANTVLLSVVAATMTAAILALHHWLRKREQSAGTRSGRDR